MSNTNKSVILSTGNPMPTIGLGVYRCKPGEECYLAVLNALNCGYRHIDTAQYYGNEEDVGRAVVDSGIPRSEIFITTKLKPPNFGYGKTVTTITESKDKLRSEYIDLVLLHEPGDPNLRAETWHALEVLQNGGIIKSIGVSNFSEAHLEKLMTTAKVPPSVNQIEVHPWCQRMELVKFCKERNIVVQAYSPLAKAVKLEDPVVVNIATKLNVTPAQVLIAWSLHKGLVPLPKSVNQERQASNLATYDVMLSNEDVQKLDSLEQYMVTGWDPCKTAAV